MGSLVYNTVNMIIGKRGTGKTVFAKGDHALNITGLFDLYLQKNMKVLIIDTFDHPTYRDVKYIPLEKINLKWKKGVYRHYAPLKDIDKVLDHVNQNYWNGALFLEDAVKYLRGRLSDPVLNLIGDSKQKNVDLFFMYHSWALAPKDLYRYLDYIEIFKTKDSPETRKNDLPGCFNEVFETWTNVMKDPSPFKHLTVDTGI